MATERKKKRDIEPIMAIGVVVLLLASVAILSVFVYDNYIFADEEDTVVPGSTVKVDYVGSLFEYYDEDGALIFDTSIKDIAESEDYSKIGGFSRTTFSQLSVVPGSGGALKLFENALIGYKVGDEVRVEIPYGEGYISKNKTISNEFTIGYTQYFNSTVFEEMYDLKIVNGVTSTEFDTIYGWKATAIYDTTKEMVKVTNNPDDGDYELKSNELNTDGANAKLTVHNNGTELVCTLSVVDAVDEYMVWVDLGYRSFYIYDDDGINLMISNDPPSEGMIYFVITIKSIE